MIRRLGPRLRGHLDNRRPSFDLARAQALDPLQNLPVPPMRHKLSASHLRAVRGTRTHGLGNRAHWQALQFRQNIAPEIHAIERAIIAPRDDGFALLRSRSSAAALSFERSARILASGPPGAGLRGAKVSAAMRWRALQNEAPLSRRGDRGASR
jgi:hypothetical protein